MPNLFWSRWSGNIVLVLLAALPLAARGDLPPQVSMATPGSSGQAGGTIDRFTLRFSEAMVALGDPRATAPATSTCPGAGAGRWVDAQTWVLEFSASLPPATRCAVTLRDGLATLAGSRIIGLKDFAIDTAGPSVRAVLAPGESGDIDEDQVFLVATNGPADIGSVVAHASCAIDGLGEAVAVDVLPQGTAAKVLGGLGANDWRSSNFLSNAGVPAGATAQTGGGHALDTILALKCRRPLPPNHGMALVWPHNVTDPHGVPAGRDQRFDFTVRAAFEARFECSRINGKAGCNPITPAQLVFATGIDRAAALAVRMKLADGSERSPTLDDDQRNAAQITNLNFAGPFPADSDAHLVLPDGIHDLSGRPLANAGRFPLTVHFDPAPPLVKFAAPFGIIEANEGSSLPVTVRAVEPALAGHVTSIGAMSSRIADDDRSIAEALRKVAKANEDDFETIDKPGSKPGGETVTINHTGEKPILQSGTPLRLGLPGKGRDFEVVGIPLGGKGFHLVEVASPALGAALLGRKVPRYVAAGALVTDMAVHFKWGRESSLVWVTRLSTGQPVGHAAIRISDSCNGRQLAAGQSDASGRMAVHGALPVPTMGEGCSNGDDHPLMVSARADGDMSFALSSWDKGIAPYDFDLPFGQADQRDVIHTVFDRTLVRIGETVHFRHIVRHPGGGGFAFGQGFSGTLVLAHQGSDTRFTQNVAINGATGGDGEWTVPQGAPLGDYALSFETGGKTIETGQTIRVDEYKLPTMRATITGPGQAEAMVQPASVPLSLFVGYLSGGGAGQLPVTLRSQFSTWFVSPKGWDAYSFGGDAVAEGTRPLGGGRDGGEDGGDEDGAGLPYAQTLPATLGADGTAHADVTVGRAITRPLGLTVEMDYPDANGQTMTASRILRLFPAALQVGIKTDGWMMRDDDLRLQMVVLDLSDKPVSGTTVHIDLYTRETITARRRLIGGFYAYDNQEKVSHLAGGCTTTSDSTGRAECKLAPGISGQVIAVARVTDAAGHETRAVRDVWLAGKDAWWFGGDNGDRMDVIPEATEYRAGETARFQVRMPFREATALVTVEREGVLSSFVTTLSGNDPVVEVPMPGSYAPNVYVSVMAVRGRVGGWTLWMSDLARRWHLPFFQADAAAPTATVDLAKPSYRLGVAQVHVGWETHRLAVAVSADHERYRVRDQARIALAIKRPDGTPAAGADVTLVAVDEALLQLMPNHSWDVLGAMMGERNLEVVTSTAQMQVVGKRHYGRKAVAAGGGGGDASGVNRENFQPVLLWRGHVPLDAAGQAHVDVPLSDALSRFRIVAVATDGAQLFGTGQTSVRTAQDLSIYPGLPDVVRSGDRYDAVFTLKNGSDHPMTVTAQPTISPAVAHAGPLTLTIPAGAAGRMRWGLTAPANPGTLTWTLNARSSDGHAHDSETAHQDVVPAVPETVMMASLMRVGDPPPMIAIPQGALPGGWVGVVLSDTLAAPLDGVRRYMTDYPYNCLEQRLSRIVANGDSASWTTLAASLPTYIDADGLARYWPDAGMPGSPELTAYVMATTSAAGLGLPDDARRKMIAALQRVVTGQLRRDRPYQIDDRPLRLAALAALARAGAADAGMVARIDMVPADIPTGALADWMVALDRVPGVANAATLRAAAAGELRRRLVWAGTRLDLADKDRAPWWMMVSADDMAIHALDAVIGRPDWAAEVPRMMAGVAARQLHGAWDTTPANAWGTIVSHRFATAYPPGAIAGTTHVALAGHAADVSWPRHGDSAPLRLPLAAGSMTLAQTGGSGPWATVSVHAAVRLTSPLFAGYRLTRTVSVVSARQPGRLSQGDVLRVRLEIDADAGRTWVALGDPLPPGAVVMSSLGGQSQLLQQGTGRNDTIAPAWVEGTRATWRAYFDWLPQGHSVVEYTVRLNSAGQFTLPPSHIEAMYAPAIQASLPNAPVTVTSR